LLLQIKTVASFFGSGLVVSCLGFMVVFVVSADCGACADKVILAKSIINSVLMCIWLARINILSYLHLSFRILYKICQGRGL